MIYYAVSLTVLRASVSPIIAIQPGDSGLVFCGVVEVGGEGGWRGGEGLGAESKKWSSMQTYALQHAACLGIPVHIRDGCTCRVFT